VSKDEALCMAMEAFEWNYNTDLDNIPACEKWAKMLKENIAAIKEALAQPEPVANGIIRTFVRIDKDGIETWKHEPFYTTPPRREWVGLTDEEYKNIRYGSDESGELYVSYTSYDEGYECGSEIEIYVDDFAKAIEAKLREKNGG